MLRKICSIVLLFALGALHTPSTFANENNSMFINARSALQETANGETHIEQINALVEHASDEKLEELLNKVYTGYSNIDALSGTQYEEVYALLSYLEVSISETLESRLAEKRQEILTENISAEDALLAEKEILSMQSQVADSLKESLSQLMIQWEEMSSYEEKGDLDINMSINSDAVDLETGASISNYSAKTQKFNQEFNGYISAFTQASGNGKNINLELQSFIDFISKDGNMYLLLDKLSIKNLSEDEELLESINPYIEKFQKLAEDKTYVSYTDQGSQVFLAMLESFSVDNITTKIDEVSSKALLEAYNMQDGNYLLRPTKYFCDLGKELSGVFDPFSGSTCSDAQYENMLEEMYDSGTTIILSTGKENLLSLKVDNDFVVGNMDITGNNKELLEVSGKIMPKDGNDVNMVSFLYIPNQSFVSTFNAEGFTSDLNINFSRTGTIKTLNLTANYEESFDMSITYQGKRLNANLKAESYGSSIECSAKGELKTDYADLTGKCDIISSTLGYMFPGETELNIESSLFVNTLAENNNVMFNMNAEVGKAMNAKFELKNIGTRKSIPVYEIQIPENSVAYEEVQEEIYEELYGDIYSDDFYDETYEYEANYDDYSYTDDEGNVFYCNTYEYDEEEDYDHCTEYISEEEYYNSFEEYEYEDDGYDYDDYSYVDEAGNTQYCNTYEYDEEENYDYCTEYISEEEYYGSFEDYR